MENVAAGPGTSFEVDKPVDGEPPVARRRRLRRALRTSQIAVRQMTKQTQIATGSATTNGSDRCDFEGVDVPLGVSVRVPGIVEVDDGAEPEPDCVVDVDEDTGGSFPAKWLVTGSFDVVVIEETVLVNPIVKVPVSVPKSSMVSLADMGCSVLMDTSSGPAVVANPCRRIDRSRDSNMKSFGAEIRGISTVM
ncbi:hypothetical protein BN946_scf184985.g131 [Trametes cinnabarina]|uniref:Uncharacterized protein n=1 Tax=Pycnoporus cinnabarinus TaxID=5643 RepID=A0A060SER5_PYCCI|nr:hypothetical protein BN946_scf184985.g131 [Trametes cinnabarina]